jgi:hypothetical protein
MSYTLHTDKTETFECSLALEGASLKNAFARLILEVDGLNVMFNGTINENGKCSVSIENLKKIFPKNCEGNMFLEVVADDTYFSPWKDSVELKPSKSLTVEVITTKKDEKVGPKLVVNEVKGIEKRHSEIIKEVMSILQKNTRIKTFSNNKISDAIEPILNTYFLNIGEPYNKNIMAEILKEIRNG